MAGLQFQNPASLSLRGHCDDDNDYDDDDDDDDIVRVIMMIMMMIIFTIITLTIYIHSFIHYSLGIIGSFHE